MLETSLFDLTFCNTRNCHSRTCRVRCFHDRAAATRRSSQDGILENNNAECPPTDGTCFLKQVATVDPVLGFLGNNNGQAWKPAPLARGGCTKAEHWFHVVIRMHEKGCVGGINSFCFELSERYIWKLLIKEEMKQNADRVNARGRTLNRGRAVGTDRNDFVFKWINMQ